MAGLLCFAACVQEPLKREHPRKGGNHDETWNLAHSNITIAD
jgi:hypothetical protein